MIFLKYVISVLLATFLFINKLWAFDSIPIRYLGIEHGLSNNSVTYIYQDHKGFMWFGTFDGLNRYDGYEFKVFRNRIGDSTSLIDNTVYNIDGDKNHNLWIGCRKGLSIYNPVTQSFSTVSYTDLGKRSDLKISGSIHALMVADNGNVLVGTANNGLIVFPKGATKGKQVALYRNSTALANYEVIGIEAHEKKEYAWIFVENEGLGLYDPNSGRVTIVNTYFKKVNRLRSDKKGHLWIGTDNGLFKYDIATNSFSGNYIARQSRIINVSIDRNGTLWVASDGSGVFTLPDQVDKAIPLLEPGSEDKLSSNAVFSVYIDRERRKWIGTLRGGINIVEARQNPFQTIYSTSDRTTDPDKNFINAFCETSEKNIWIGTSGGGLKHWDRKLNVYIISGKFSLTTARFGIRSSQPGDPFSDMFIYGNQRRGQGNREAIWVMEMENPSTVPGGITNAPQHRRVWVPAYYQVTGMKIADSLGGRGIARLRLNNFVIYGLYEPNDMRNSRFNFRRQYIYNDPARPATFGKPVPYTGFDTIYRIAPHTTKWYEYNPLDEFGFAMIKDIILMRLGETYLLLAEAQFKQGKLAEAAATLTTLRARSNASAVIASQVSLDYILDERVRELVGEENRRMTLMRTGTLVDRAKRLNAVSPLNQLTGIEAKHLLMPIPQSEINLNKDAVLEQNPGY